MYQIRRLPPLCLDVFCLINNEDLPGKVISARRKKLMLPLLAPLNLCQPVTLKPRTGLSARGTQATLIASQPSSLWRPSESRGFCFVVCRWYCRHVALLLGTLRLTFLWLFVLWGGLLVCVFVFSLRVPSLPRQFPNIGVLG